jgi:hypothetical protein
MENNINNLENLSIMYFSCYSYKNLWNAFLQNKQKYLGNNIKMYFCIDENKENMIFNQDSNTEIISYNKRSSYKSNGNFLQRLLYSLNNINTEYIIYYYDDMFMTDYVNVDKISKILVTLQNNSNIKIVKLSNKSQPYTGEEFKDNDIIYNKANKSIDDYLMNLQPIMIRKDFFINLINECINNIKWKIQGNSAIERVGTEYIKTFGDEVICLKTKEDIIPIINEGGILSAGILYDNFKEWLKSENLFIKTYKNNFIYDISKEELNYIGDLTVEQIKTIHNIDITEFD